MTHAIETVADQVREQWGARIEVMLRELGGVIWIQIASAIVLLRLIIWVPFHLWRLRAVARQRHRRLEPGEPESGEPFIPEHLSDDARGCIETIKMSMPSNIYSVLDSFILSAFATAWALHKLAAHKINAPDFRPRRQHEGRRENAKPVAFHSEQAGVADGDARRSPGARSEKPRGAQDAGRETTEEQIRWPARAQLGFDELKKLKVGRQRHGTIPSATNAYAGADAVNT